MNDHQHHTPPQIAARILGWLLPDEGDTRIGDYEEYFNEQAASRGPRRARWWYRGQVARLLPDQVYEKVYWEGAMLASYLVLGFRNLRRDRVSSLVNLIGLSSAVACVIALFLLFDDINASDDFHVDGDRIFMVGHTIVGEEGDERWGTVPAPLGPALASGSAQVERAVRFASHPAMVRSDGATFHEVVSFADVGFFDVFTFPLRLGEATALADPDAIVLSADAAVKYFGTADPIGQTLDVTFAASASGDEVVQTVTVAGVAEPFPSRADFRFDLLVGYEMRHVATAIDSDDWKSFTDATFLQLRHPDDAQALSAQLSRYVPVQNAADETREVRSFFLDSVQHPDWLTAWNIEDRALQAPLIWESIMFGVIALLMLLVACFNYITISLGAAARRLKEIGVRKTVGGRRSELIKQFLAENLVLCALAVAAGVGLAWAITVPFLNDIVHRPYPLEVGTLADYWPLMVGLLLFLAFVSGSYPAFYVSSFQPSVILRDRLKLGEKKGLVRTLTVIQLTLALITICLSIFTASLDDQLLGGDWGYDQTNVLVVEAPSQEHYDWLRRQAEQSPHVQAMAGAKQPVGASGDRVAVRVEGTEQEAFRFHVGPDYLATLGIEATAGRTFGATFSGDGARSVVVNQTFAKAQPWADPIGQSVLVDDQQVLVVGVVGDVLLAPMAGAALPVVFALAQEEQFRYLTLRVEPGATDDVAASLRTAWARDFPGLMFTSYDQADVFVRESMSGVSRFITYLALFALLISCMGLFGLASQRAARKVKEVGVRKAMGASALHIVLLINRSFLIMLGIATLIATPLCYVSLSTILRYAPVDLSLGAAPFVLSNALVFLLAAATLSLQTSRLIRVKPADVLRYQ